MLPVNQPMGIDQCNCFAVRKAARQISRMYDGHLQPTGLRNTQFLILAALEELGSAAVNELAERLDVERTAMGKMLALLERDGFADIRRSRTDARSHIVKLTRQGRELYERAAPLWREAQAEFSRLNGTRNVGVLRRSLADMKVDDGTAPS
jgi:DNA-binding MarR family transcriptional regulator